MNVPEQNRGKTDNILSPAICLDKKTIFGRLRGYFSKTFRQLFRQTASVLALFCSVTFMSIIYKKTLTFIQRNGSYASSKKFVGFLVLAHNVKLMETSTKL